MTEFRSLFFDSPLGTIEVRGTATGITDIRFVEEEGAEESPYAPMEDCRLQLLEYLVGKRRTFDSLPLVREGTDFMLDVWDQIAEIPFGETRPYKTVAQKVRRPEAVRAVGTACGKNRLCLIIPCHRVVPSQGDIGKYVGGDLRKEWLLEHERSLRK